MRKADRPKSDVQNVLNAVYNSDGQTELERAKAHYKALIDVGGEIKTYEFSRYKRSEVKTELEKIFHGKCAYCESPFSATQPVDVEHYRPKGPVEGVVGHPGYWWLAADWLNLLPACIDCNRRRAQITPNPPNWRLVTLTEHFKFDRNKSLLTGKQSAFPLAPGAAHVAVQEGAVDDEPRLLLDPTRDDPDDHLVFHVDRSKPLISLVYPKPLDESAMPGLPTAIRDLVDVGTQADRANASPIGAVSIQVYGLNRLGLVQARTRLLRDLDYLAHTSTELDLLRTEFRTRVERREAERDAAVVAGDDVTALELDLDLDQRAVAKLGELVASLRAKIIEKTDEKYPYSAVAKAWVRAYLDDQVIG
ncbi:hypothetical protein [Ruegeria arenilitoris]|uniref:hypothetical protein n=1 Tax=Ruegeria arenilitoris TaxID=1173585 RepID=UPI00147ED392|nr:hypothetical protein [Ruegeria arenilitoris]